jgi:hypothetical protein
MTVVELSIMDEEEVDAFDPRFGGGNGRHSAWLADREFQHGGKPMLRRTSGIDATLRPGPPTPDRGNFEVFLTLHPFSPAHLPWPCRRSADDDHIQKGEYPCTSSPWSLV